MRRFSFRFVMTLLVSLSVFTATFAQNKGFDVSRMNTSTEACTDFFRVCQRLMVEKHRNSRRLFALGKF